jgi:hypothetical protein
MFYDSPEWHNWTDPRNPQPAKPPFQIVVHSPEQRDDPMAMVQFFNERTVIVTEYDVEAEVVRETGDSYTLTIKED